MPTTAITPQITAEVRNSMGTLAGPCYAWGGKYETAFQALQKLVMGKLYEGISGGASSDSSTARKPRTAAITPETVQDINAPKRSRGRPAGSKNRARASKKMTVQNAAILSAIAAGYNTPALLIPELQRTYDIVIRPNHLGMALGRLRDTGYIVTDGTVWNLTQLARAAA